MEERERIVEVEREPVVERHTTVVSTGDRGGGGGTAIVAILLVIVALVVLYFVFMRGGGTPDPTDINVKVDAPKVELPSVTPSKE